MNRLLCTLTITLVAALMPFSASAERADPEAFYQIPAFGDFQTNLEKALSEGKKGVLLYFHQDQCPFCKQMERRVFTQPIVHEFFHKHFDIYKVNIKGNKEFVDFKGEPVAQSDFAVRHRARATPTLIIFGENGEELVRFVSNPSLEEMLALGKFVVDGAYQDGTDFFNYKRAASNGIEQEIREQNL
ncbi:thioredoxin family protein [Thiohalorhabdus sp.]|uniref:thioredoxin family protein n=1 Tax=Thiohalorhabdus sp. TaxID=3094134 RepID=UPI002FC310D2